MQHRAESVLVKVCLALACALGAGFSGDMHARTSGHGGQRARHSRTASHRSPRAGSRETNGDLASELDHRQESVQSPVSHPVPDAVAEIAAQYIPAVQTTALRLAPVPRRGFNSSWTSRQLPPRAPPVLA